MNTRMLVCRQPQKHACRVLVAVAWLLLCLAPANGVAQDYWVVHNFAGAEGAKPYAGLVASGPTLYGTAVGGGSTNAGTIFSVKYDASDFSLLKSFLRSDGQCPYGGLILSADGTLYGTTFYGGNPGGGTAFRVNTNGGGFALVRNFTGSGGDGQHPEAGLVLSGTTLYGVTYAGGSFSRGTLFRVNTDGSGYGVLYQFTGGSDGRGPEADLILADTTLFGTTSSGGSADLGTVFKINTDGSGFTVVQQFSGANGAHPEGSLLLSGSTLYGTTTVGGSSNLGTVFRLSTDGSDFMLLKSFAGSDGRLPKGRLIQVGTNLYGMTYAGGSQDLGTVYQLDMGNGDFRMVKSFLGSDGANPYGGLVCSGAALYGTTYSGGPGDNGTVFGLGLPSGGPTIVIPPRSQTVLPGSNISFRVYASGLGPLAYQWHFNGTNVLAGATTNALELPHVQPFQAGAYTVVVTNSLGAVTSAPAWLQVLPPGTAWVTTCTESALRAALDTATTVRFACDGTIALGSSITIENDHLLDAADHQVTISGGGTVPVFRVENGVSFTILNLGIADGRSSSGGGGVYNSGGTLNATNCVFSGNTAYGITDYDGLPAWGGAVYNAGWFNASRCIFRGNRALGGTGTDGRDGSYVNAPGSGLPGGSAYGGAIYNWGTMLVERSLFASNNAAGGAGGRGGDGNWFTYSPCPDQSGGNGNQGGAGLGGDLFNDGGTASVVNCTFAWNGGTGGAGGRGGNGGLINWNPHSASGCPGGSGASGGGGSGTIYHTVGQCHLTNCTIAANGALAGTGGARGWGSLGQPNGLPGSDGSAWGGLTSSGSLLVNVLLATNLPGGNASGVLVDGGCNLSSDDTCHFTAPGSLNNTDPRLGPLDDNGGSTLTMPLLPGSPAIDGGNTAAAPATDQRGFPRPFGLAADIGALEVMPWLRINRAPEGGFDILASGLLDKSCQLLASSNLSTWLPIATNPVGPDGTTVFHDTFAPDVRSQFYRVVLP